MGLPAPPELAVPGVQEVRIVHARGGRLNAAGLDSDSLGHLSGWGRQTVGLLCQKRPRSSRSQRNRRPGFHLYVST